MISNSCIVEASVGTNMQNYGFLDLVVAYPRKHSGRCVYIGTDTLAKVMNDLKRSKQTLENIGTKYYVPLYYSYTSINEGRWVWN